MVSSGRLVGALSVAAVDGRASTKAWWWLAASAASFVAGALLEAVSRGVEELISARYLGGYQDLLLDTAVSARTVDRLQSDAGAAALDQAASALQHWLFLRGVGGIWGVVSNQVSGIGALVIVAAWHWWIAVLLLIGWVVMSRAIARWRSIVFDDTEQRAVPLRHRAAYLNRLLAGRSSAKEIRLFGLADWLLGTYVELSRAAMTMVAGRRGEGVRRTVVPLLVLLVLHAGAFAVLIGDVAAGRVSVATLTTLVQALLGMSAFGRQDDDETSTGRTAAELSRLVAFRTSLGLRFPALPPGRPAHPGGETGPARIEIAGLRFSYPDSSQPVLDGFDLTVEAGECVAIVGANGAGKSTLLSLLCGLWRADSGTIRIDGRDPGADPSARSRIAPIFQTFLRLPLTAAENITAGNAWRAETGWLDAAAASGADDVLAGLSAGADTVLSSQFPGGTDLSGGQWQRIALARAFTAVESGAGVLALDEPTAALDVRAEVALFESVLSHRQKTTTLLITHRLSSVRHADRIVVLDRPNGRGGARVLENGSHDELIKLGGSYARMFTLQASRFIGASQ
jgi:ATP-binding cassette, subfamily B, bacterial